MFKKEENNIYFTIIHIFSLLGYKHISDIELYFRVKYKRSNSINVNVERYTLPDVRPQLFGSNCAWIQ